MTESRTRTDTTFEDNVPHERVAHERVAHEAPADGATAAAPMGQARTVPPRQDRVRWGPVWAGLIVALPTFILLQVATLALGWWDVGGGGGASNADWLSGVNGLIALFLGGLTAGASSLWRGFSDGLLHGILVWALTVVTIVFLTLFGGGALLGSLAGVVTDVASLSQGSLPNITAGQAADVASSSAAWATLGLGSSIIAASLGGVLGAKMWPSRRDAERQRVAAG